MCKGLGVRESVVVGKGGFSMWLEFRVRGGVGEVMRVEVGGGRSFSIFYCVI